MDEDRPWVLSDLDYLDEVRQAQEWWEKATPEHRRTLWDAIQSLPGDPANDNVAQLAELAFFRLVRDNPDLPVGDKTCDTPSLFSPS